MVFDAQRVSGHFFAGIAQPKKVADIKYAWHIDINYSHTLPTNCKLQLRNAKAKSDRIGTIFSFGFCWLHAALFCIIEHTIRHTNLNQLCVAYGVGLGLHPLHQRACSRPHSRRSLADGERSEPFNFNLCAGTEDDCDKQKINFPPGIGWTAFRFPFLLCTAMGHWADTDVEWRACVFVNLSGSHSLVFFFHSFYLFRL